MKPYLLLLACFTCQCSLSFGQNSEQTFFYNDNKKQKLKTIDDEFFVGFDSDSMPILLFNWLKSSRSCAPERSAWLKIDTQKIERQHAFAQLKRAKGVRRVSAAFATETHDTFLLTSRIVFKAKQLEDETAIFTSFFPSDKGFNVENRLTFNDGVSIYIVKTPDDVSVLETANRLFETGRVAYAMPDFVKMAQQNWIPNDSLFTQQWFLKQHSDVDIDADSAWEISRGRSSLVVAMMDANGVELAHPDFVDKWQEPYNAVEDNQNLAPENPYANHAQACAGLIGARNNNQTGVASVGDQLKIMPIQIGFNTTIVGSFQTSTQILARAANKIIQQPNVVANSMSYSSPYTQADADIYDFIATEGRNRKGIVMFASAGNTNSVDIRLPAIASRVWAVGATTNTDALAEFSNYGSKLAVVAPGVGIVTTDRQGENGYNPQSDYTTNFSGTSAACPIVAAVAGLIASVDTQLNAQQIAQILLTTTEKVGTSSYTTNENYPLGTWSFQMGYGRVNAHRALLKAADTLLPDLTILADTVWVTGNALSVHLRVGNTGRATVAGARVTYFLSADNRITTADIELGSHILGVCTGGGHILDSFSVDVCSLLPNVPNGRYFVGYIVDPNDQIAERLEFDNTQCHLNTRFQLSCGVGNRPDLRLSMQQVLLQNDTIRINYEVVNAGNANASSSTISFLTASDTIVEGRLLTHHFPVPPLSMGQIYASNFAISAREVATSGSFYIKSVVDIDDWIDETNENNNCYWTNRLMAAVNNNFNCSNTQIIAAAQGLVTDGSGEQQYENNSDCRWLLRAPVGNPFLTLQFLNFKTQLNRDWVYLYAGSDTTAPRLAAWSGAEIPPVVTSPTGQLLIRFVTDGTVADLGWTAQFSSSPFQEYIIDAAASPRLMGVVRLETGNGRPSIRFRPNEVVRLVATPTAPQYEFVCWRSDSDTLSLVDTFQFLATSHLHLMAEFRLRRGCQDTAYYRTTSGSIEDGSGNLPYANNADCWYSIIPSNGNTTIELNFTAFDTENCCDYVEIYEGFDPDMRWIGSVRSLQISDTFVTNTGVLHLHFVTNGTVVGSGWRAHYTSSQQPRYRIITPNFAPTMGRILGGGIYRDNQGVTLVAQPISAQYEFVRWHQDFVTISTSDTFQFSAVGHRTIFGIFRPRPTCRDTMFFDACAATFTDGSDSLPYGDNLDCYYRIRPVNGDSSRTVLRFSEVSLASCCDYVEVYSYVNGLPQLLGVVRSPLSQDSFMSVRGGFLLHFVTDAATHFGGWRASYYCPDVACFSIVVSPSDPQKGSTTGGGNFAFGSHVMLVARAAVGYRFLNWTNERNEILGTSDTLRLRVTQGQTLVANFVLRSLVSSVSVLPLVRIAPNPHSGSTVLLLENIVGACHFDVFNALGQCVFSGEIAADISQFPLSVDIPSGFYFLSIKNKNYLFPILKMQINK